MSDDLRRQFEKLGIDYYNRQGEVTVPPESRETMRQIKADIDARNETMKVMNAIFNKDVNKYVMDPMLKTEPKPYQGEQDTSAEMNMIESRGQFLHIKQQRALKEYENARNLLDIKKKNLDFIKLKTQLSGNANSKELALAKEAYDKSREKLSQAQAAINAIYAEFDQLSDRENALKAKHMKDRDLYTNPDTSQMNIPSMRDHNRNMSDSFIKLSRILQETKENDWASAQKGWQRNY